MIPLDLSSINISLRKFAKICYLPIYANIWAEERRTQQSDKIGGAPRLRSDGALGGMQHETSRDLIVRVLRFRFQLFGLGVYDHVDQFDHVV